MIKKHKKIIATGLLLLLFINVSYFYHDYFYNYKFDYAKDWQYNYKKTAEYVKTVGNKYDYVWVTGYLARPYIYFLFYGKTDPATFRKTANITRDVFGFVSVNSFGKYHFSQGADKPPKNSKGVLYINVPEKLPKDATVLKKFYLPNGEEELVAYKI
jgi:hypothetical protein